MHAVSAAPFASAPLIVNEPLGRNIKRFVEPLLPEAPPRQLPERLKELACSLDPKLRTWGILAQRPYSRRPSSESRMVSVDG